MSVLGRIRRAGAAVLLCLALAFWAAAGAATAKPPMWIARSNTATVILFGSIHLLPAGLDWRPADLDAALDKADELWFELPITPQSDRTAIEASHALENLPGDETLSSLLTPSAAEKLKRAADALHCSFEALDRMRPWMAELTLSLAQDAQMGASASSGVEDQIQAITAPKVKRSAFETPAEQIALLAKAPMSDQIASLDWTLHEIEDDPQTYRRVVDAWMAGDTASIERDALDPLRRISPNLYQRLLAARNRRWTKRILGRLRGQGLVVVVVGVGHLLGPDGVPAQLRASGVSVEGP